MKVNTSALIAELLLGGGLLELVVLLALDGLSSGRTLAWILGLNGTSAGLLAGGAIVLAYFLGSLLNALSRAIFSPVEQSIKRKVLGRLSSDESLRRRLSILERSPEVHGHIDEIYAQVRIFRSAGVAFGLLLLVLALRSQPAGVVKWFLVGVTAIMFGGSIISSMTTMRSYFRVLRAGWENLSQKSGEAEPVTSPKL